MTDSLIAPLARARFVVTLPPEPSHLATQLRLMAGTAFTTLTDTSDAFQHLAKRAKERLVIMTPFIDPAGAAWASDMFEATQATKRELVVRNIADLGTGSAQERRLRDCTSNIHNYLLAHDLGGGTPLFETFHAKVVLADGIAAYVGSANFLYRSRETNLECGFLLEGASVAPVAMLVEAVLNVFN